MASRASANRMIGNLSEPACSWGFRSSAAFVEDFLRNDGSGKIIVESEPGLTAETVSRTLTDVDNIVRAARSRTDAVLAEKLNETQKLIRELYETQGRSFVLRLRSLGAIFQRVHSEHSLGTSGRIV